MSTIEREIRLADYDYNIINFAHGFVFCIVFAFCWSGQIIAFAFFVGHVKSPLHSEQFAKKVTCLWEYSLLHAINKLTLFKLKLSKVYPHRHFQDPKTIEK